MLALRSTRLGSRRGLPALECCRAAMCSRSLASRPTAPLPPIPDPPEGSMLNRIPQKEYKISSRDLVQARSFLGFNRRATHPESYRYLIGRLGGGHAIIDPDQTLWAMRKVMAFLKKVVFCGGRVLFVSTDPMLARLTRVVGEQTDQFYLAKRWVPGILTNWEKGRAHVQKTLNPQPDAKGRIKNIDVAKANSFAGVEGMGKPPDVVVVLDGTALLNEASSLNIPVVAVVDSDLHRDAQVDYAIPANTKSLRFHHTLAQMLVRAINEGRGLREELDGYALKQPNDERDDGARRQGSGMGTGMDARGRKPGFRPHEERH